MSLDAAPSQVEASVRQAILNGDPVSLATFGGEGPVVREAAAIAASRVFGDVAEALGNGWQSLSNLPAVSAFLANGLRSNRYPDTIAQAMNAIVALPKIELRPMIRALDLRARDPGSTAVERTEAVSGLLRLALRDDSLRSVALAAILALDDINDAHAGPRVCRLASVAYEHFRDEAVVALLEQLSDIPDMASQASYERGLVEIGIALAASDLPSIAKGLRIAERWFKRSVAMAEDRRDSKAYLLLLSVLVPVSEGNYVADRSVAADLRREAVVRHLWDRPTAGAEWLLPPHGSELGWLPLVDKLVVVSEAMATPGWQDAGLILDALVDVHRMVRSVQPSLGEIVRPAIEATFIRERGLLAQFNRRLADDPASFGEADAVTLRRNIGRRLGEAPGKE